MDNHKTRAIRKRKDLMMRLVVRAVRYVDAN